MSHATLGQFDPSKEFRCVICYSRNPKTAPKCRSCEEPYKDYVPATKGASAEPPAAQFKFGLPATTTTTTTAPAPSFGGSGGFAFGSAPTTTTAASGAAPPLTFGGATGFSFGAAAAAPPSLTAPAAPPAPLAFGGPSGFSMAAFSANPEPKKDSIVVPVKKQEEKKIEKEQETAEEPTPKATKKTIKKVEAPPAPATASKRGRATTTKQIEEEKQKEEEEEKEEADNDEEDGADEKAQPKKKLTAAQIKKGSKAAAKLAKASAATNTKKTTAKNKKMAEDNDDEDRDDAEEEDADEEDEIQQPKKRGRPRKNPIVDPNLPVKLTKKQKNEMAALDAAKALMDDSHTFALHSTQPVPLLSRPSYSGQGRVLTFGAGECAQLGLGYSENDSLRTRRFPAHVKTLDGLNVVAIAAGALHNLALTEDGRVWSWGCNDDGALGRITKDQKQEFLPQLVDGLEEETIISVAAGASHSLALAASGRVYSWGAYRDGGGLIGFDEFTTRCFAPICVPGLEKHHISRIACGESHCLALSREGGVFYWGDVFVGRRQSDRRKLARLQPQTIVFRAAPSILKEYNWSKWSDDSTKQKLTRKDTEIIHIISGGYTSMAISASGLIWVWGPNNYTQSGIPRDFGKDRIDSDEEGGEEIPAILYPTIVPFFVQNGLKVIAACCANQFSLFLTEDRRVWGVGRHAEGRIGQEKNYQHYTTSDQQVTPLEIKPLSPQSLSSQDSWSQPTSSAVTTQTHEYFTTRKNDFIVSISCGESHALAITNQGRIFGWGIGDCFQLGNGLDETCFGPYWIRSHQLATLPRLGLSIGCGSQHSIVLCKDAVTE